MFTTLFAFTTLLTTYGAYALPTGSTLLEQRAPLATVYKGCSKPNTVAITFDDGPYDFNTDIVNILNDYGAKATFFVNGDNYQCIYSNENAQRLKTAYGAGHQIASHTWAHPDLSLLGRDQISSEFSRVNLAIEKIIGARPAFVRPPFGNYNNLVREVAREQGQSLVIWDFDSGDTTGASPEQSESLYRDAAAQKPSTILALNHEIYASTAYNVLPYALQQLTAAGYELVTVAECLGKNPYTSTGAAQPRDDTWSC